MDPKRLRRTILLHFGPVTFRFHFGEIRNVFIFVIFVFWTCSWLPKPIILISETPELLPKYKKIQNRCDECYLGKFSNLGNQTFRNCWGSRWPNKTCRTAQDILDFFEYGINSHKKTWIGKFGFQLNELKHFPLNELNHLDSIFN